MMVYFEYLGAWRLVAKYITPDGDHSFSLLYNKTFHYLTKVKLLSTCLYDHHKMNNLPLPKKVSYGHNNLFSKVCVNPSKQELETYCQEICMLNPGYKATVFCNHETPQFDIPDTNFKINNNWPKNVYFLKRG